MRRICDRAIVLDHGKMVIDSTPGESVRVFRESLSAEHVGLGADDGDEEAAELERREAKRGNGRITITNVQIEHPGTLVGRNYLLPDEAMSVRVQYRSVERTDDVLFGIAIYDLNGNHLFGTNTAIARLSTCRPPTATVR